MPPLASWGGHGPLGPPLNPPLKLYNTVFTEAVITVSGSAFLLGYRFTVTSLFCWGGSVAEWLAC